MAEGAAVWLLEDERSARARGAPIKGRIVATVRASDPTASSIDWGRGGECLARALLSGLARQNIDPTSIDLWLSSASGSRTGDALEASVYRQVFSGSPPPLLAPKSIVGEYGGGFLAASLLAIEGTPFGPTRGFETPDPALGITPHMGEPLARPQRVILSSLGAGGAACWVVIDRA